MFLCCFFPQILDQTITSMNISIWVLLVYSLWQYNPYLIKKLTGCTCAVTKAEYDFMLLTWKYFCNCVAVVLKMRNRKISFLDSFILILIWVFIGDHNWLAKSVINYILLNKAPEKKNSVYFVIYWSSLPFKQLFGGLQKYIFRKEPFYIYEQVKGKLKVLVSSRREECVNNLKKIGQNQWKLKIHN